MKVRICPECETENKGYTWHCINCGATLSVNTIVDSSGLPVDVVDGKDTAVKPSKSITHSKRISKGKEQNPYKLIFFANALTGFLVPMIFLTVLGTLNAIETDPVEGYALDFISLIDWVVWSIGFSLVSSLLLANFGSMMIAKRNYKNPIAWAFVDGCVATIIVMIPALLAGPFILFAAASVGANGGEVTFLWLFFAAIIGTIIMGTIAGFVAGLINRRWRRTRSA